MKLRFITKKPRLLDFEDWFELFATNPQRQGKLFSCPKCNGYGSVFRCEDYDPIEGYKIAERRQCPECKGEKFVSKKHWRKKFDEYVDRVLKEKDNWEKKKELVEKLELFLDKDDIMLLNGLSAEVEIEK